MDIFELIEIMIDDIVTTLKPGFDGKVLEESFYRRKYENQEIVFLKLCELKWEFKASMAMKNNNDILEIEKCAEWFLYHLHKWICRLSFKTEFLKTTFKLDQYLPSEYITETVTRKTPLSALDFKNAALREYMKTRNLNAENIYDIFKLLVQLEDVAEMQEYVPLIQRNVTLYRRSKYVCEAKWSPNTPNNIVDMLTPNLDLVLVLDGEKRNLLPSINDVAIIKTYIEKQFGILTGTLKEVNSSSVNFEFCRSIKLKNGAECDLIFYSQRKPIRYQYRALEMLKGDSNMRSYLFPKNILPEEPTCFQNELKLINERVATNPEQLQAVHFISSGPYPQAPYIIFGPPGTGKTTTVVESILQLRLRNPKSRILVAAGSNSACDTVASLICEYFKSSSRLKQFNSTTQVLPMIRIFSKSVLKQNLSAMSNTLREHSNIEWDNGEHAYPAVKHIRMYGIVVATLCTVGKLICAEHFSNYFSHVFIDEAAASTEPEALIGIMGIKDRSNDNCCIILAGDHKQLGPVLKSKLAISLGLNVSLMQRLLNSEFYALDKNGNYDRRFQTRLRRNYRSHEEIVNIYNSLYYNNELLAMISQKDNTKFPKNWSFLPESSYPIVFQAVHGVETKEGSTSSCNMLEINVLMWYIKRLVDVDFVDQNDIGVISPYKLQCMRIRNCLKRENLGRIEVNSVEHFQGREKEIILASMVRSFANLGFLQNPNRLNVLLSRAKSLLLIMGNPLTLRRFKDMEFVIDKCKENGTFLKKKKKKQKHKS